MKRVKVKRAKLLRFRPLTIGQLKTAMACQGQVHEFCLKFGASVNVTEKRCLKYAMDFAFPWAIRHLLPYPSKIRSKAVDALERVDGRYGFGLRYETYRRRCAVIFARAYLTRDQS